MRCFNPRLLDNQAAICYNYGITGKETSMRINEKIYIYRKKLGISQEALAEMLNISRQAISKWETGEATPDSDKLLPLARIFGVTADHLLSDDDANAQASIDINKGDGVKAAAQIESKVAEEAQQQKSASFIGKMIKKHGYTFGAAVVLIGLLMCGLGIIFGSISGFTFIIMRNTEDEVVVPIESADPSIDSDSIASFAGDDIELDTSRVQTPSEATNNSFTFYIGMIIFIFSAATMIVGASLILIGIALLIKAKKEKLRTAQPN